VPVIGRFAVGPAIVLFPYTRAEGLGRAFQGEAGPLQLAIAAAITAGIVVALGPALLKATLSAVVVALLLAATLRVRLGGLTGDAYGATIEIAEVTAAFVATLG
jgi:adenosylcobinamide-GDP ribazoletransferase